MQKNLSAVQKSYIAGFLDGDGSIYVRLKPNLTYRYGFQVAPYIVLFQSAQDQKNFEQICSLIGLGYLRVRKDGVLEYTIAKKENIVRFLDMVSPYSLLKKEQIRLMMRILKEKETVESKKDFEKLMTRIDSFRNLNYSKKRKLRTLTP